MIMPILLFIHQELALLLQGKTVSVLVEGISDKKNEYFGYSDTNKLVNFTGDDVELGSIIPVEITEAKTWSLDGKVSK